MEVIKKDGRVQAFDILKIRSSILEASIDSNTIINESDLKILSHRVLDRVKVIRGEKGFASTYEIFAIIIETLSKKGFKDIANSYIEYKSKKY